MESECSLIPGISLGDGLPLEACAEHGRAQRYHGWYKISPRPPRFLLVAGGVSRVIRVIVCCPFVHIVFLLMSTSLAAAGRPAARGGASLTLLLQFF